MAVKARETITVSKERDINATWRFYKIASSASTPSQPTEAQGKAYVNNQTVPSGWSISEPAYDGTSTNSLYTCDLTSFSDGGVNWSVVSKSSSYEAAKQAYNEAQNAKKVATNFMVADSTGIMVADMRNGSSQTPSNPSGRNVLIDSDSVDIRNGRDTLASFGSSAVIGQNGKSRAIIDYHSLQMIDAAGYPYFVAADMRDESGNALIYQEFECTYSMYDNSSEIDVIIAPAVELVDILDEDGYSVFNDEAHAEIIDSGASVEIETRDNHSGEIWTLIYRTTGEAKYYTLGQRDAQINKGAFSIAAGYDLESSGYASMAEGYQTKSRGKGSHTEGVGTTTGSNATGGHAEGVNCSVTGTAGHAEGNQTQAVNGHAEGKGTYAYNSGQTAMGWYNKIINSWHDILTLSPEYLLVIGNGTSADARSNALVVTWSGSVIGQAMAGMIQMFAGTNPPKGWLKCDGSAVSRTTYSRLFAVIGTTYGAGNGSTTFNLPNFTDRMPIGAGNLYSLNAAGGNKDAIIPYHNHSIAAQSITGGSHSHTYEYKGDAASALSGSNPADTGSVMRRKDPTAQTGLSTAAATHTHTLAAHNTNYAGTSGNTTNANLPPYRGINFIICTGRTDEV